MAALKRLVLLIEENKETGLKLFESSFNFKVMKDVVTLWNRLVGSTYGAVRTNDCPESAPAHRVLRLLNGKYKSAFTWTFLGVVGILSGLFVVFVHPYDVLYRWKCIFSDGGEIFEMWRTPPVDLYLRVYLWNVTNRDEFMSGVDDKLKVQEVGPYVYRELMSHENVTFNANGTLTASPRHQLVWVPELSEGRTEEDLVIMPNIALLSIAHVVSDKSYFTKLGLNILIRQTNSQPLVEMTAREFMFGYSSTLMTLGNNFMPAWIYFDKLGLIDRMYDFDGDFETVYTGENDISKTGLLDTYRGSTKIPQWDSPCGDIKEASDGTKFKGFLKENDTLIFFRKSMCRAKTLVNTGKKVVNNGLNSYVYTFANDLDDNGFVEDKNKCFCKNKDRCLPPGLLDVHGCYYGFPIALSFPHYLDGDKALSAKVEGVYPDPEKHRSFFIIQPDSGLPVELAVRYQINMALGDIKYIANTERFDNMILPLLWTENRLYTLPDRLAIKFRLYLNVLPVVEQSFMYIFFITGIVFFLVALRKFLKTRSRDKVFRSAWKEDNFMVHIERKLSSYVPEKRSTINDKELEVYLSSLVRPLQQEISFQEFLDMKEEDV